VSDLEEKIEALELQIKNLSRMVRQQSSVIEANLGEDAAILAIKDPITKAIQ